MNLRTPQEIVNNLTEKRRSLISKVIAKISSELEQSFGGQPLDIWLTESDEQLKPIEQVLRVKLKNSGWCLTIHPSISDYRNGSSTKITVSSIDPIPLTDLGNEDQFEQQ